jgi:hypothetical protein
VHVKTRLYAAVCLSALCALVLSNAALAQDDLESRFAQFQQQFESSSRSCLSAWTGSSRRTWRCAPRTSG